jgi:hypothetical protein
MSARRTRPRDSVHTNIPLMLATLDDAYARVLFAELWVMLLRMVEWYFATKLRKPRELSLYNFSVVVD